MTSYPLNYFAPDVREAIERATQDVQRARDHEIAPADVIRALAEAGAFDSALGCDGIDAALLHAIPPRTHSTGLLDRFRKAPTPGLSSQLRGRLDDARFHARGADASSVEVVFMAHALSGRDDEFGRVLADFDLDSRAIEAIYTQPAAPAPEAAPRKMIDTSAYTVDALWDAIEELLEEQHGSEAAAWFAEGATDEDIARLETTIGRSLPADVRASQFRHNGSLGAVGAGYELMSCARIASEWTLVQGDEADGYHDSYTPEDMEASEGVEPTFWSAAWIPVLQMSGKTEYICCDLGPTEHGTVGQLITYAMDDFDREIVFPSFHAYLSWMLNELINTAELGDGTLLPDS